MRRSSFSVYSFAEQGFTLTGLYRYLEGKERNKMFAKDRKEPKGYESVKRADRFDPVGTVTG
jgi:hypothetical protein